MEWYFPILAGKSHHKNRQIRLMEEILHQLTGSFFGGISSHPGHLLRHHPTVFVGAVPRSAWPRRVVQHWSLGACMRRPEKKGRQVAGFVGRAFIMYLYLVPMKRYVGSMYDTIYFALQGTNISPFESMNFRLSAGGICDRFLEST